MSRLASAEEFKDSEPLPLRAPAKSPKKFPVDALGSILSGAAKGVADKVQCPLAIAAQSVLSAAALAAQSQADVVHPATGDRRPLSLALVTIAASGERKSAADKIALEPIRLREAELYDKNEAERHTYENAKATYERQRRSILRQSKDDVPPEEIRRQLEELGKPPRPPLVPLLTAPDPTIEGLHKLMAVGEPSLGVFSDEGGSFVGGYGMADEFRLRTGAGLSDLWDGKPVKRVRGGDGVTLLRGRRVTLHLMLQPGIADQLLADEVLQQQGLTSRLLVSSPPSLVGSRFQRPIKKTTEPALKQYLNRMLKLLRLPQPRRSPESQELDPPALKLEKRAAKIWREFADECEARMAPDGSLSRVQSFANKLPEHVLRIAGVLQLVENHRAKVIPVNTLKRAIRIGRYYASEAVRLADESSVSQEVRLAERLLIFLRKDPNRTLISLAYVYQKGPHPLRTAEMARRTMRVLERYNWVRPVRGGAKVDGKRHREVWQLAKIE